MSTVLSLANYRGEIEQALTELLNELESAIQDKPCGSDVIEKLTGFLFGGKMIRGSLICLIYQLFTEEKTLPSYVYRTAAAEEIFASALLIHDDIMDRDRLRRGQLSIYAQYEQEALKINKSQAEHYGYSQGINLGDISFFWVQDIISSLTCGVQTKIELQKIFAQQSLFTGLGQMLDVEATMLDQPLTQAEIESIALNKTARYSFVLPFLLGATLAKVDRQSLGTLTDLGKTLGTLFQIKDDELGLFGSEADTGKPEGNDVKEGKQTLFNYFASNLLENSELETFKALYGSPVSGHQLATVRNLVKQSGAFDEVQTLMLKYRDRSLVLVEQLPLKKTGKDVLKELIKYNVERNK